MSKVKILLLILIYISKIFACPPGGTWEKQTTLDPNSGIPPDPYESGELSTEPQEPDFYSDPPDEITTTISFTRTTERPQPPPILCFILTDIKPNNKSDCHP